MRAWLPVVFGWMGLATVGLGQEMVTGPYADEAAYLAAANDAAVYIGTANLVGLASSVQLVIDDQVSDRCWTNATAIAARVRAELEKYGIAVFQEQLAFNTTAAPLISIVGLGYRLPSSVCFASLSMDVRYWSTDELGSLAYTGKIYRQQAWATIWSEQSIFTNAQNVDQQSMGRVQEWIDTYIADISKARREPSVREAYKRWENFDPMTQVEFDEMISTFSAGEQ